jgi:hypothetical protein
MLVKKEQELGRRKSHRVNFERSAFIILVPDAPWIECSIIDISETGVCLKIGLWWFLSSVSRSIRQALSVAYA